MSVETLAGSFREIVGVSRCRESGKNQVLAPPGTGQIAGRVGGRYEEPTDDRCVHYANGPAALPGCEKGNGGHIIGVGARPCQSKAVAEDAIRVKFKDSPERFRIVGDRAQPQCALAHVLRMVHT